MPTEIFGDFEWDSEKRDFNLWKHGVDFMDAIRVFDDIIVDADVIHPETGEKRVVVFGMLDGVETTLVYAPRGVRRRIISARRSHRDERTVYHAKIQDDQ